MTNTKEIQKVLFKKFKKVNKTYVVLILYDMLKQKKVVKINYFCQAYGISIPTFRRYLSLIREYLWENYLLTVTYDREKSGYYIVE